jgi:hypothetical protein
MLLLGKRVGETGVSPWRKTANEVSVRNRGVSKEELAPTAGASSEPRKF